MRSIPLVSCVVCVVRRADGSQGVLQIVTWSKPVSLDDVKLIKNVFGVTVNDVLVSALTAAFRYGFSRTLQARRRGAHNPLLTRVESRSYLLETDQLLEKDLLTAIPGSSRNVIPSHSSFFVPF